MDAAAQVTWIHYLPVGTTLLAALFSTDLMRRYLRRGNPNLLWWAGGIACYGFGTLFEAVITLFGNSVLLTKGWYVAGAILGGYPLAQGSVYLLHSRRFANTMTAITLPVIVVTSVLVFLSPVVPGALEPHRPSGAVLSWRWVRLMTPFINIYAVFFLIGGAAWSAWRYYKLGTERNRAIGNTFIATGAILPGVGGSIAKVGSVEALYILEFLGLIFILAGDRVCSRRSRVAVQAPVSAGGLSVGRQP
jgi:hypothetical protein